MQEILSKLDELDFVTTSPIDEPVKLVFVSVVVIILLEFCLQLVKHINHGITFSAPKPVPLPIEIQPGKNLLPEAGKIKSYKSPSATSVLFITCYFLIHFMIFVLFKRIDYSFNF